jgi:hypothetical protein
VDDLNREAVHSVLGMGAGAKGLSDEERWKGQIGGKIND